MLWTEAPAFKNQFLFFFSFMALTAVFDVCTSEEPNHNVWNIVIETEQIEDAAGRE